MNINVEDVSGNGTHTVQAGFLARLAPRHIEHVWIVFDVPAELRPDSELGVMREQDVRTILIDYPGRAGQVAGLQISVETGFIVPDEIHDSVKHPAFPRVKRAMRSQLS
jgi:hypothetical protein